MPDSATRLVSLHDGDARPIRKGRTGRPVEFGYKAQVLDNDDGIVVDYSGEAGNPPDAPQLAPAINRIARHAGPPSLFGHHRSRVRRARGRAGTAGARGPHDRHPAQGQTSAARRAIEHARGFRRLVKWRTGWTAAKEPPSGAGREYSPTTWSRSAP
jgi:transposase, IS5 family